MKFEEAIEHHLTHHGYSKADSKNFDGALALDPTVLLPFIRETQPAKWRILADYHGKNESSPSKSAPSSISPSIPTRSI